MNKRPHPTRDPDVVDRRARLCTILPLITTDLASAPCPAYELEALKTNDDPNAPFRSTPLGSALPNPTAIDRPPGALLVATLLAGIVALGLRLARAGRLAEGAGVLAARGRLFAFRLLELQFGTAFGGRWLTYSGCMRSHGLSDFPGPTVGSNGLPNWSINAGGNSDLHPNSPKHQSTHKACRKDLPNLGPQTPAEKAVAIADAVKYAQCMRSHVEPDFPDPNGQGVIQTNNPTGILDPSSPQFQRAQTACQSLDKYLSEQGTTVIHHNRSPHTGGGS